MDTINVKLLASKNGATGIINAADFDPRLHAMLDETPAPTTVATLTATAAAPVSGDDVTVESDKRMTAAAVAAAATAAATRKRR